MNIIERIKFIEKLSFEKQLLFAVLCAERCYREIIKVFPNFVTKETSFQESLICLWKRLNKEDTLGKEAWQFLYGKIHKYFEQEKKDSFDLALMETARAIYFALGMLVWAKDVEKTSASNAEKTRKVISEIYDEEDSREYSLKELEWLTRALHLISESEKTPTNYEWFLEKNSDYERGKIHKIFKDIE